MNVSHLIRRRGNDESSEEECESLTTSNFKGKYSLVPGATKQAHSTPNLIANDTHKTPEFASTGRLPQPAISEVKPLIPKIICHSAESEAFSAIHPDVSTASNISSRPCNFNTSSVSLQQNHTNVFDSVPQRCVSFGEAIPEATSPSDSPPSRPHSGSWTGVNESEDELGQLAESPLSESLNIGGSVDYGSLADSSITCPTTSQEQYLQDREHQAGKMRRQLKFFFMNPVEKWHARHRFPWKLLLQVFKIIVVTIQLWLFAAQRYLHVAYLWDTRVSFSHMFLLGWESTREVLAYPPSDGPLAVYTRQEFYDYIDFAVVAYTNLSDISIGSYEYHSANDTVMPSHFCCEHYTESFARHLTECIDIPWAAVRAAKVWSALDFFDSRNFTVAFDTLLNCQYFFKVKAVKLRSEPSSLAPDCYNLTTTLVFDNDDRDGQMLVGLNIEATVLSCHSDDDNHTPQPEATTINILTMIMCCLSLLMCCRSLYRAQLLRYSCVTFFHTYYRKTLSKWDELEFCNFWYVLICINDILIIIGTLLKLGLESRVLRVNKSEFVKGNQFNHEGYMDTWNICSLFLGVGNLLVWFGCLRYLGFFQTYNVLILTLKKCLPNVLRYSICITMLFAGYCLCGWLILSPYHIKFRSLSTTMECLYSLINGDDMFATFSSTSAKDPVIWWFSRIYLYSFISLFVYVILSLFLAIIMDAYDTIKRYYAEGFPKSPLQKFVEECQEDATSHVFREEGDRTIHDLVNSVCCCCLSRSSAARRDSTAEEREPLIP
ncbi:mucolipin-3 isoform X2 [Hyalella azteca]|uniref:Mucolipin-3 isoform X2 n=1 Tax=Hyalella azteca TaxID=294128 RepID=A0A8B7NA21_HYAAZ|nr:mucolipin-3 isoform X2 [Hyalella azteca]